MNPWPRPRGFVFKARTWGDYERWRAEHANPWIRCKETHRDQDRVDVERLRELLRRKLER